MKAQSATITVMIKAARKAARHILRDFGELENLQVSKKGVGDFVSSTDKKAEEIIRAELQLAKPDYSLLCEESGAVKGNDPDHCWIVDPLDGTINFIHGLPYFGISIALEKQVYAGKREVVAGVIYAPALKETYWAERGAGAWLERGDGTSVRLRVAARRKLEDALIGSGCGRHGGDKQKRVIELFSNKVAGIRAMGSSALELANVAAGKLDMYIQHGDKAWDVAAGILLVREAGGFATTVDSRDNIFESGNILATNDHLHKLALKALA